MTKVNTACIIEDNSASIFWIKEIMNEVHFANHLITYTNGKEALDDLSEKIKDAASTPEVIFLDINMPVMDGWEFLDEFSKIEPAKKIHIYVLTSSEDPEDTVKAEKYKSIAGYIVKPVTEEKLKEILVSFNGTD